MIAKHSNVVVFVDVVYPFLPFPFLRTRVLRILAIIRSDTAISIPLSLENSVHHLLFKCFEIPC